MALQISTAPEKVAPARRSVISMLTNENDEQLRNELARLSLGSKIDNIKDYLGDAQIFAARGQDKSAAFMYSIAVERFLKLNPMIKQNETETLSDLIQLSSDFYPTIIRELVSAPTSKRLKESLVNIQKLLVNTDQERTFLRKITYGSIRVGIDQANRGGKENLKISKSYFSSAKELEGKAGFTPDDIASMAQIRVNAAEVYRSKQLRLVENKK